MTTHTKLIVNCGEKIYKTYIFNNDSLDQVLEDQSLYWNDDKEIVEAIEIYLTQDGHQVLEAYDGIEAVEILKKRKCRSSDHGYHDAEMDGIRATLKKFARSTIFRSLFCLRNPRMRTRYWDLISELMII